MWNKLLWGVEFTGRKGERMLIGECWSDTSNATRHDGEPTRALLFCTRAQAREWCADENRKWRERAQLVPIVSKWRVRPVRVRETVVIVEGGGKP